MKYRLEIQLNGFNVDSDTIIDKVKNSLKENKITLKKVKDLKVFYVPEEKTAYYTCMVDDEEVSCHVSLA